MYQKMYNNKALLSFMGMVLSGTGRTRFFYFDCVCCCCFIHINSDCVCVCVAWLWPYRFVSFHNFCAFCVFECRWYASVVRSIMWTPWQAIVSLRKRYAFHQNCGIELQIFCCYLGGGDFRAFASEFPFDRSLHTAMAANMKIFGWWQKPFNRYGAKAICIHIWLYTYCTRIPHE